MLYSRFLLVIYFMFCCCFSVAKSCPTLCNSKDYNTPDFRVSYHLLESAQVHVYWTSDAIQSSHPLSASCPSAFTLWTFRLLLCRGCCNKCCNEHWGASFLILVFSKYMPRSGIAGSYVSSLLLFFLGTSILPSLVTVPIYIPTNSAGGLLFPYPLLHLLFADFSVMDILTCVR